MTDEAEAFLKRMHEVEHTVALGDAAVEAAVLAERKRCLHWATYYRKFDPIDIADEIYGAIEDGRQP